MHWMSSRPDTNLRPKALVEFCTLGVTELSMACGSFAAQQNLVVRANGAYRKFRQIRRDWCFEGFEGFGFTPTEIESNLTPIWRAENKPLKPPKAPV
jgi:hypothetical protein